MTVNLTPEQEQLLSDVVRSGAFESAEQALQRALEWMSQQQWLLENRDAVSEAIEEGFAQAERGELYSEEESRQLLAAEKRAWMAQKRSV